MNIFFILLFCFSVYLFILTRSFLYFCILIFFILFSYFSLFFYNSIQVVSYFFFLKNSMFSFDTLFFVSLNSDNYLSFYLFLYCSIFCYFKIFVFDIVLSLLNIFFFSWFVEFLFMFLSLPFFLFSPFFINFLFYQFFYFFLIYSLFLVFFFFFFNFICVFCFVFFIIFFLFCYASFFKMVFFSRFYDLDLLLRDYVLLESDELWVNFNFMRYDKKVPLFRSLRYRLKAKEKESFYTLIKLFFDLKFNKTIFNEQADSVKFFNKKFIWNVFDLDKISPALLHLLVARGVVLDPVWLDFLADDKVKLEEMDFEDEVNSRSLLKKSSVHNTSIYNFQKKYSNVLKNLYSFKKGAKIKKLKGSQLQSLNILSTKTPFGDLISKETLSDSFQQTDIIVPTRQDGYAYFRFNMINDLRITKFVWTTLFFLAKSTIDRVLRYPYATRRYTPSVLDLYKVCEFFYSINANDSEFYEEFRYINRLKKIREFYGDTIFNDLMTPEDHEQSQVSRIKLNSDNEAQFTVITNPNKKAKVIMDSKEMALKLDSLIASKFSSGSSSSSKKQVNLKDFVQDLDLLYKAYAQRIKLSVNGRKKN